MALYQIVCMCILFACCGAQYIPYVDPQYDPNPAYSYTYNVNDPVTGDAKSQTESRQGDFVQGEYSLIEPDGSLRSVQYTAAPGVGFNAVVSKTPGVAPPNDRLIRGGYAGGRYPYTAPAAVPLAYRGAYAPVAPFY